MMLEEWTWVKVAERVLRGIEAGCYINTCTLQWMLYVLFMYLIFPFSIKTLIIPDASTLAC